MGAPSDWTWPSLQTPSPLAFSTAALEKQGRVPPRGGAQMFTESRMCPSPLSWSFIKLCLKQLPQREREETQANYTLTILQC